MWICNIGCEFSDWRTLLIFILGETQEGLWGKGIFSDAKQGKHTIEGYLVILNNASMRKYRRHKDVIWMAYCQNFC